MPLSIEKMQKFLKLEAERKFDNKAIVGGLDKVLPTWAQESRKENVDENIIREICARISSYPEVDVQTREQLMWEVLQILQESNNVPPRAEQTTAPEIGHPIINPPPIKGPSTSNSKSAQEDPPSIRTSQTQSTSSRPLPSRENIAHGQTRKGSQPESTPGLNAPLTVLQGIGPQHARELEGIGLYTLGDLLYYFPRRYDDFSQMKPINRIQYGEELSLIGTIQSIAGRPVRGGSLQVIEAVISDGSGYLRVNWFNQPWLVRSLKAGTQVVLSGKIDQYLGKLVMNSPEWEPIEKEHLHTNRIVPVYPLTAGVTQKSLRRILHQTITFWAPRMQDHIPDKVLEGAGLVGLSTALFQIHFPDSQSKLSSARARLAFDEIFLLQLGVLRQKKTWQANKAKIFQVDEGWFEEKSTSLPYQLTNAQLKSLQDIRLDLASGRPMNRLIQGDVGSGKTVVAGLAAAIVNLGGSQAAFMAPTSILAEQHYRTLSILLSDGDKTVLKNEEIRLLIGSTPETEKQAIRNGLENGLIKLVVGTHALLENPVIFKDLQLAIVDEQHRFGVEHRSILRSKGTNPHLLVMTATPIPRSLALTVYGDLDLSVMDEMPPGRQPIETHVIRPRERERAYQLVRSQIALNHQAFIIYPLIEQGEREEVRAAVQEHDRLQNEVFPNLKLGLMHGRLKADEKDSVMEKFRSGEYHILVSTSVVEVGVDVPNATVMLIEGANRFGLAQLHQFRGRVGRGDAQSFCLLIPETEDATENERLAVMEQTNDGFVLAEKDLEQRGPGQFLGTRQSGFTDLRLASLSDVHLIEKARHHAQELFEIDPNLTAPEHQLLLSTLHRFWGNGKGDIS